MKTLDPASLVFIDESGFSTKMARLRGRSERGTPCIGAVPFGHWGNNTFIAGLRHDRVVAPMLIPGAVNGKIFAAWVEQALAPTLGKGDIVICDNLNVHKNAAARAAIEARGARGQAISVPVAAQGRRMEDDLGLILAEWMVDRFGGTAVDIPIGHKYRKNRVRDGVRENPDMSANQLARKLGVTRSRICQLRKELGLSRPQKTAPKWR